MNNWGYETKEIEKRKEKKKYILASDLKLHSGTVEANSIRGLTTEFPQKLA